MTSLKDVLKDHRDTLEMLYRKIEFLERRVERLETAQSQAKVLGKP